MSMQREAWLTRRAAELGGLFAPSPAEGAGRRARQAEGGGNSRPLALATASRWRSPEETR